MDSVTQFFQQPVQVWHLAVVAIAFGITVSKMQKQWNAIGKLVFEIWEKHHPLDLDLR